VDTSLPTSQIVRPRVLLVNDPSRGSVVAEQLTHCGYDVFWARDTMEARWLWLPNFYDLVLIRLPKDANSGNGFVQRIRRDSPRQRIAFWDDWAAVNQEAVALKRPVVSIRSVAASVLSKLTTRRTPRTMAKIIQMPKR
jgi:CheY-like chemotaxis protein